ncbi:MAG: helicase, partial [Chloroflexia bacterium]|nr:helicase [Chloroflexia bacterium]
IHAYNFMPETELEAHLGLREKLERRIREIHETIGEDAAILDPGEQLNEEAMYVIYTRGQIGRYEEDDVDEYVDLNEAIEIVRQLKEDQPELYRQISGLRDGVRCGRRLGQEGAVVFCRAGRYRQLFQLDENGEIASRDISQILNLLKCAEDTPAAELPPGHNQAVMRARRLFEREVQARRAEQKHAVSLTRAQRYVRRELQLLFGEVEDADLRGQISLMEAVFTQPSPRPAVDSALKRLHREKLRGLPLLDALAEIYRAFRLGQPESAAREAAGENDEVVRIVCSEALRG